MLSVWSAIMASTFCSVLPLTLRVDCFPTDNTLAVTFITWKSEMSFLSLMENVWENVLVRNCRWCYARFFLYSVFFPTCTAPGNRGLNIINLDCYLLLLCFLQFSMFFRRITVSSHHFWWWLLEVEVNVEITLCGSMNFTDFVDISSNDIRRLLWDWSIREQGISFVQKEKVWECNTYLELKGVISGG